MLPGACLVSTAREVRPRRFRMASMPLETRGAARAEGGGDRGECLRLPQPHVAAGGHQHGRRARGRGTLLTGQALQEEPLRRAPHQARICVSLECVDLASKPRVARALRCGSSFALRAGPRQSVCWRRAVVSVVRTVGRVACAVQARGEGLGRVDENGQLESWSQMMRSVCDARALATGRLCVNCECGSMRCFTALCAMLPQRCGKQR